MRRNGLLYLMPLCAWLLLSLSACGKKPNQVDPPPGAGNSGFPHTYPDPATDPEPEP